MEQNQYTITVPKEYMEELESKLPADITMEHVNISLKMLFEEAFVRSISEMFPIDVIYKLGRIARDENIKNL